MNQKSRGTRFQHMQEFMQQRNGAVNIVGLSKTQSYTILSGILNELGNIEGLYCLPLTVCYWQYKYIKEIQLQK